VVFELAGFFIIDAFTGEPGVVFLFFQAG